ncbi:MAG: hypothetical protein WCP73_03215 [Eubacteriales bacterium]
MLEPIKEFKTIEEAIACLKEWQTRLFLDDWIIKVCLVEPDDIDGFCGQNRYQLENKCCVIELAKMNPDNSDRIMKFCHERVMVHELLHCKYNFMKSNGQYESSYFDAVEHALLEQMGKSLIMAKYNLPFEWFKNF